MDGRRQNIFGEERGRKPEKLGKSGSLGVGGRQSAAPASAASVLPEVQTPKDDVAAYKLEMAARSDVLTASKKGAKAQGRPQNHSAGMYAAIDKLLALEATSFRLEKKSAGSKGGAAGSKKLPANSKIQQSQSHNQFPTSGPSSVGQKGAGHTVRAQPELNGPTASSKGPPGSCSRNNLPRHPSRPTPPRSGPGGPSSAGKLRR